VRYRRICVVVPLVRGVLRALAVAVPLAVAGAAEPAAVEVPGPSAALFAAPFYVCARTYYVAPTGSDANVG
jgi:hypothetical protein